MRIPDVVNCMQQRITTGLRDSISWLIREWDHMRLLVLTYEFPPLGGGAGNAAAELVRALEHRSDMEIDVVTSSMGDYAVSRYEFTSNSTIYYLPVGKSKGNIHYQTNTELLKYTIRCHQLLKKLHKEHSYRFCHAVMTVPAGVNAWLFRKKTPYLVSLQGSDVPGYAERYKYAYTFLKPIICRIWKDSRAVVSNSSGLRDLALAAAPLQKVDVIPNGIDRDLFSPNGDQIGSNGKLRVVCVGRLIERKGVWDLVTGFEKVLQKIPHAHLDLIGDGPIYDPIRNWVSEHGFEDKVTLHGTISHDELPRYLRSSAVFVLPSYNEGMSNALLEGISCGLPIVVTETGGTSEMFNGNGFICPMGDPKALASAIVKILENEQNRKNMAEASLQVAARYSWEKLAEGYAGMYD